MITAVRTPAGIRLLEDATPKVETTVLAALNRCCNRRRTACPAPERCEALYLQRAKDWRWPHPYSLGEQASCTGSLVETSNWLETFHVNLTPAENHKLCKVYYVGQ